MKAILYTVLSVAIVLTIVVFGCNAIVVNSTKERIYDNVNEIPECKYGLLLGTTPAPQQSSSYGNSLNSLLGGGGSAVTPEDIMLQLISGMLSNQAQLQYPLTVSTVMPASSGKSMTTVSSRSPHLPTRRRDLVPCTSIDNVLPRMTVSNTPSSPDTSRCAFLAKARKPSAV